MVRNRLFNEEEYKQYYEMTIRMLAEPDVKKSLKIAKEIDRWLEEHDMSELAKKRLNQRFHEDQFTTQYKRDYKVAEEKIKEAQMGCTSLIFIVIGVGSFLSMMF